MTSEEDRRAQVRAAQKTFRENRKKRGDEKLTVWISAPASKRLDTLAKAAGSKDAAVEALIMDTKDEAS